MPLILPIETARLRLTSFREDDGPSLHVMERDPEVKRFTGSTLTREQSERLLRAFIDKLEPSGLGTLAIREKTTDRLLGLCGLVGYEEDGVSELFFGLARFAWGHGFATEAARALVDAGFAQLGWKRVVAEVEPANLRSVAVLERIGMQLAGRKHSPDRDPKLVYQIHAGTPLSPLER